MDWDENSSFSHRWTSARRSENVISMLKNREGRILLRKEEAVVLPFDGLDRRNLNTQASWALEGPFEETEIWEAIRDLWIL